MSAQLTVDEKVLGRFFDASLDLMCVADFEGRFKRMNHAWTRTLGWTLEELMSHPYLHFVHPDDVTPTATVAANIAAGGDEIHFENRYRTKNGDCRRLMWRATPDTERGLIYAVGRDVTDEKQAEERMQAVVDNATAVVFMKDAGGRYLLVNRLFEQLFHLTRDQIVGRTDDDIFPPRMAAAFRENDHRVLEAGAPLQFEELAPHDDGPHTYVSVKFPLFDAAGKATVLCGIATDITERKRAEQELRDREARLQSVMDTALDGIITMDEDRVVRSFNVAAERLFGYAAEEMIGRNVNLLMPEPYRSEHDGYVRRYLETGEKRILGIRREVRGRKKDGTEFPLELSVSELVLGGTRIFTGTVHDISERKRAEEAILKSEQQFRAVTESANDAIITADSEGAILGWNKGAVAHFGYEGAEVIGKPLTILMPERYRDMHSAGMKRFLATKESKVLGKTIELTGLRKDGSEFPIELSLSTWQAGGECFFSAVIRDITNRKRAEEDIQRSNEELEQFAYVASHDLKEPLRMISSYLQIIQKRYADKLDDEGREFFGYATGGARRLRALIEDLLEYSRAGTRGKTLEPSDSGRVLDDACADLRLSIAENGATITRDALPIVAADAGQLRKVFQNLLANAMKFRGADPPSIHVTAQSDRKEWTFSVRDNGIGIAPEHHERIFDIFQRLHSRDKYEGTGIGLAVCKKIIGRHGGRIWLESSPGAGTTFYFTLCAV